MWVEEWRGERGRGRPGRYRGVTTSIEIPQMAAVRFVAAAWGRTGGTQQGKRGVAAHLLLSWLVFTRDVGQNTAEGGALTYRVVPVSEGRDSTIDKR